MAKAAGINLDDVAAVVDEHTGKVVANFEGFGATEDARSHARTCKMGGVQHYSSVAVITGKEARKAIKQGRV